MPILHLNLIPQNQIRLKQKSLNSPCSLSLSSSLLTISAALSWTLSSTSISLLYQTKYSQFGLPRAEEMGKQLAEEYKDILKKIRKQTR